MNTRMIIPALVAIVTLAFGAQAAQVLNQPGVSGTATVKIDKSEIGWRASKVVGKHNGTVQFRSGNLEFSDGKLIGGRFEVDMRTIQNADIEDAGTRAKLVGHLKSDDFFSSEKFPVAVFTITSVQPRNDDANYTITGNMKIKGISKKVSFPATITVNDGQVQAKATLTLDRTKWDVKYGSGSFFDNLGDNMIHDDFMLDLDINATI